MDAFDGKGAIERGFGVAEVVNIGDSEEQQGSEAFAWHAQGVGKGVPRKGVAAIIVGELGQPRLNPRLVGPEVGFDVPVFRFRSTEPHSSHPGI